MGRVVFYFVSVFFFFGFPSPSFYLMPTRHSFVYCSAVVVVVVIVRWQKNIRAFGHKHTDRPTRLDFISIFGRFNVPFVITQYSVGWNCGYSLSDRFSVKPF